MADAADAVAALIPVGIAAGIAGSVMGGFSKRRKAKKRKRWV